MNQILSVQPPKKGKQKSKSSIKSIVIVFSIILILFGIGLTSTGAYSYYKSLSSNPKGNIAISSSTKPVITTERESSSIINLVVTHDKEIAKVTYTINDGEAIEINGNNQKEIEEEVKLPIGDANITVTAEDVNGITSSYQNTFSVEQKPEIKLENEQNKISVKVTSTINIKYIKYYWDNDEENGVQEDVNDIRKETLIDALPGTHTLNIIAVDEEGNETTKTQKINGVAKPKIEVTTDGQSFIINASDEEELSKIEITLNSKQILAEEISGKEYTTNVKLEDGENKIIVKVYNKKELSEISKVKYTKE